MGFIKVFIKCFICLCFTVNDLLVITFIVLIWLFYAVCLVDYHLYILVSTFFISCGVKSLISSIITLAGDRS